MRQDQNSAANEIVLPPDEEYNKYPTIMLSDAYLEKKAAEQAGAKHDMSAVELEQLKGGGWRRQPDEKEARRLRRIKHDGKGNNDIDIWLQKNEAEAGIVPEDNNDHLFEIGDPMAGLVNLTRVSG